MLHIRALSERQVADPDAVDKLFGPKFLLERPLLAAVRAGDAAVLLIDEIDRADDEFEAFLLEVLSDFQISIPEIGTVRAGRPPLVVLTSNRTRELHDALKRRCLYHWIGYPAAEREAEIVLISEPGVSAALARKVVAAVHRLRKLGAEGPDPEVMLMLRASAGAQGTLALPSVEPGEVSPEHDTVLGRMASDADVLKHKSFAACTPEELAALRRIMTRIRLTPPRRRTRRTAAARSSGWSG